MCTGLAAPAPMTKHVVVGTAGHIDHGKTSLVKALTGIDTDRLPEEKARGITIDLGFAFLEEPAGLVIEIVDVPGHERFVKNMLAGVGGIDLAMLVVAADEGVMPQTREHLAICSLLHVKSGLVVLTKTDLVERDWLELVKDEVAALVRGTFLEGTPLLAVSSKTGEGLLELRAALRSLAETVAARGLGQLPRLPVDRVFTVRGFGTVVAGTLVASRLVDGTLELLKDAPRPVKSRTRVRFHVGTSEIMARVLLLDMPELGPGQTAAARFRLEAPLVALPGDRFVVRSYSPSVTIGGGTILDVDPPRFKLRAPIHLAHLKLLQEGSPEEVVEEHVRHVGGSGARLAILLGRVPFGPEKLRGLLDGLVAQGRVLVVDREWYLHSESSARLRALVLAALEAFHRANPLKPGMSREELRVRTGGADERVFATLLAALEAEGALASDRDKVRLASHQVRLTPEQQRIVDRVEQEFRKAEASPPSPEEALGRAGVGGGDEHELFQLLVERRKLVRVKESLYFHAAALDTIQDKVVALLRERKEIGPGDIKDLLGISRKYAIPLLEHLDARRVTVRTGEKRVLRGG